MLIILHLDDVYLLAMPQKLSNFTNTWEREVCILYLHFVYLYIIIFEYLGTWFTETDIDISDMDILSLIYNYWECNILT